MLRAYAAGWGAAPVGGAASRASRMPFEIVHPAEHPSKWRAFLAEWARPKKCFCFAALPMPTTADGAGTDGAGANGAVTELGVGAGVGGGGPTRGAGARVSGLAVCWDAARVYWLPLGDGSEVAAAPEAVLQGGDNGANEAVAVEETARAAVVRVLGGGGGGGKRMVYHAASALELLAEDGYSVGDTVIDVKLMAGLLDPNGTAASPTSATATTASCTATSTSAFAASLPELLARFSDPKARQLSSVSGGCTGVELCCLQAAQTFGYVTQVSAGFQQTGLQKPLMTLLTPLVHAAVASNRGVAYTTLPRSQVHSGEQLRSQLCRGASTRVIRLDAAYLDSVLCAERARCAALRSHAEALTQLAADTKAAAEAAAEAVAEEKAKAAVAELVARAEGGGMAAMEVDAPAPLATAAAIKASGKGSSTAKQAAEAEEGDDDGAWALRQLSLALRDVAALRCGGASLSLAHDSGKGKAGRKRPTPVASDVALSRVSATCEAAAVLVTWRRSDAVVRTLEALSGSRAGEDCSGDDPLGSGAVAEVAIGDRTPAGGVGDDGAKADGHAAWQVELSLVPCAYSCRLQPTRPALAKLLSLTGDVGAEEEIEETEVDAVAATDGPSLAGRCVFLPHAPLSSNSAALTVSSTSTAPTSTTRIRIRLPQLSLRLLCHLSKDSGLQAAAHAAHATPPFSLLTHLSQVAGVSEPALCLATSRLLHGLASPPPVSDADAAAGTLFGAFADGADDDADCEGNGEGAENAIAHRHDMGDDLGGGTGGGVVEAGGHAEGEAADAVRAVLRAFPGITSYHASLVRAARAGRGILPTLGGRQLAASPLLRSESQREQSAASAALLGDVCRASADEVSGLLIGGLHKAFAPSDRTAMSILAHGRCEIVLEVCSDGCGGGGGTVDGSGAADGGGAAAVMTAVSDLRAAVAVAARGVEQSLALSVPLQAEVELLE